MIIILLGLPGCGKGTQGKILSAKRGFSYFCVGDQLRKISEEQPSGELATILKTGQLAPVSLVNSIVADFINDSSDYKNFILDGYPRSNEQALYLEEITELKKIVLFFDLEEEIITKRIMGRFSCDKCMAIYNEYFAPPRVKNICDKCEVKDSFKKRYDDNEVSLKKRIDEYKNSTYPIIEFYKQKNNLYIVNADQFSEKVTNDIERIIENI